MRIFTAFMFLLAAVLPVLPGTAHSVTLVDQLWIVDNLDYQQGAVASVIGGGPLNGGTDLDSQIVDDFTVTAPGFVITDVTFDYLAFLGAGAPPRSLIEIFPEVGGVPGEIPVYSALHSTTWSSWTPLQPSFDGERHTASGLNILLGPGDYWIGMQPITITGQDWGGTGDILFPVQHTDTAPAVPSYFREPGLQPDVNHDGSLGFGPFPGGRCMGGLPCPDFTLLSDDRIGLADGDTSFKVEGFVVPEPSTAILLALGIGMLGARTGRHARR